MLDITNAFFKEQIEFMPVPRPAGIEEFLRINVTSNKNKPAEIETEKTKVTFEGNLSIDEQKINEMIRIAFTQNNVYKATTGLDTLVVMPFSDVMDVLQRAKTPANKKKFARQLRTEILPHIAHQHLEIRSNDGSFLRMDVGGGYFGVDVRKDTIFFKISDPYALYLNTGSLSQYNSRTLRLGTPKKPLPFYLAVKLQDQYFCDGNRNRTTQTHNILKVSTLLDFCSDIIPSFDYIQQTDPGHWTRRIRLFLESALNEITEAGLFTWRYCKKGREAVAPEEIEKIDYRQWERLYIAFDLIPGEPDQAERLEHKQERKAAAQDKKALKEAELIVKASRIQRRKHNEK